MSEQTASLQGIVIKKLLGAYHVQMGAEVVVCSLSSRLRKELIYPIADPASLRHVVQAVDEVKMVDPVAIGDVVEFLDGGEDHGTRTGRINNVLPRRNKLTRRAPGPKPLEQVIVANIDQMMVVFAAAQPRPKWHMLDRYLVSAEACEVPACIAITKYDLVRGKRAEREISEAVDDYRAMGYTVIVTSAEDGMGLGDFRAAVEGRVSVFVGMSGVGKTSLLNSLQPDLGLRVNHINTKIDKGRHTTTHLEMFALDAGGAVVDTPGMKQFGLWDVEPESLALHFAEMRPFVGQCRFGLSCTHDHEPGCAIKDAVEAGTISERRYASYLYLCNHVEADY